jgi:hypothetical protein
MMNLERHIEAVVQNDGLEDSSVAIVNALCDSDWVDSPDTLRLAIEKAVTAWVKSTAEGRAFWVDCGEKIDVHDLGGQTSAALKAALEEVGVKELSIVTFRSERMDWDLEDDLAADAAIEDTR